METNNLSEQEQAILSALRSGNLKYKIIPPAKPKRIPKTPEQKKALKRKYYQDNKEARKAYAVLYYQLHQEERKQKQREYYAKKKLQYLQERSSRS